MDRPIRKDVFGYVYICHECGKEMGGYAVAKIYSGKAICGQCKNLKRIKRLDAAKRKENEEIYRKGGNDAIDTAIKAFEGVDSCEFATFTLCFVRELLESLRGKIMDEKLLNFVDEKKIRN